MSLTLLNLVKEDHQTQNSSLAGVETGPYEKREASVFFFGQSCRNCRLVFHARDKDDFCSNDCKWSFSVFEEAKAVTRKVRELHKDLGGVDIHYQSTGERRVRVDKVKRGAAGVRVLYSHEYSVRC